MVCLKYAAYFSLCHNSNFPLIKYALCYSNMLKCVPRFKLPFLFGPQNCQYPPASGGFRVTNGHESIELVENRSQSPSPPGMMISHPQDQPLRGQCRESRSSSVILRRLSVNVTGPFRSQKKTFLKKQARPSLSPIFLTLIL